MYIDNWTKRSLIWIPTSLEWYVISSMMEKIWTGHITACWTPSPRPTESSTKHAYPSSIVVHRFNLYLTSSQKISRTNIERICSPSTKFMLLGNISREIVISSENLVNRISIQYQQEVHWRVQHKRLLGYQVLMDPFLAYSYQWFLSPS